MPSCFPYAQGGTISVPQSVAQVPFETHFPFIGTIPSFTPTGKNTFQVITYVTMIRFKMKPETKLLPLFFLYPIPSTLSVQQ